VALHEGEPNRDTMLGDRDAYILLSKTSNVVSKNSLPEVLLSVPGF
jgi:hypothetical protein